MRRLLLTCLLTVAVLATLAVALGAWLLHDEAFLKARLHAAVLDATGRELAIDGPLQVDLGRTTRVEARDLHLQNAGWAQETDMLQVDQLLLAVDLGSVFHETFVLRQLQLSGCKALFEENAAGESNWRLVKADYSTGKKEEADEDGALPVVLLDGRLQNCSLKFSSPKRAKPTEVVVDSLTLNAQEQALDGWKASASGSVNGEPLSLTGHMAPTGALVQGKPLKFGLEATVGKVSLKGSGSFENALEGEGTNLDLRFAGPEIKRVIEYFGLPPVSDGPFDFRLKLNAQGDMNRIDLDGDLGSLEAEADGELDRLVKPTRGRLTASLHGPNLGGLVEVFGPSGLPQEPFALKTGSEFSPGKVKLGSFELKSAGNRLDASGVLGAGTGLAGTDLDLELALDDASRLARAFDRQMPTAAALTLKGRLVSDASGIGELRARAAYRQNTLELDGTLGPLAGPLQPDLRVDFHSPDLQTLEPLAGDFDLPARPAVVSGRLSRNGRLLHLDAVDAQMGGHRLKASGDFEPHSPFTGSSLQLVFETPDLGDFGDLLGRSGWPRAPLKASGRVSRPDQDLKLEKVRLDLAGNTASLAGRLGPRARLAGTELEGEVDSPNIADLAALFGRAGLPPEPLQLGLSIASAGKGLEIHTRPATDGALKLALDARIPDLDQPLGVQGKFDLALPSLQLLSFLAPNAELPDLPVTAKGKLQNSTKGTELDQVALALGDIRVDLSGEVVADAGAAPSFDLQLQAAVDDVHSLERWLSPKMRRQIPSDPVKLKTGLRGSPSQFSLSDLEVTMGKSRAGGELNIQLGSPNRVTGKVQAPLIDLGWWQPEEDKSPQDNTDQGARPGQKKAFIFDDTPVFQLENYGVEVDLELGIEALSLGNAELRNIVLHSRLEGRHLELQPFSLVGLQGGQLSGSLIADDRDGTASVTLGLEGEGLRFGLFSAEDQDPSTYPETELHLSLQGKGRTRRELASSLNGRLRVFSGQGLIPASVADRFFSDFLTQLLATLNPLRKDSKYTEYTCSAAGADIVDGRAEVGPVVIQTAEVTILSDGVIDLRTEKIDLSFHTSPRKGLGISTATLINPFIKVGGKLAQPALELDPTGTVLKGGTAVATAGLSILARSFYDRFLSSRDPCGDARKVFDKRDAS